jgi:hypothetical protein
MELVLVDIVSGLLPIVSCIDSGNELLHHWSVAVDCLNWFNRFGAIDTPSQWSTSSNASTSLMSFSAD